MPKLGILYGSLINVGVVRAITTVIIVSKVETFRKKKKTSNWEDYPSSELIAEADSTFKVYGFQQSQIKKNSWCKVPMGFKPKLGGAT